MNDIDSSISSLSVSIESLKHLPGNPRRGNVEAIKQSYLRFGQLKPIVGVENDDGTITVIAGNHQLMAAKELGWSEIAVSVVSLDDDDAVAFALADNKVSELGSTDNSALMEMLSSIDIDNDLFDTLGWDEFAIASIENSVVSKMLSSTESSNSGWTAPEIVSNVSLEPTPPPAPERRNEEGTVVRDTPVSTSSLVTQGSTAANMSGTKNAAINFSLVFDSAEQQSQWYRFVRWLKMSPVYDGETTAERLLNFIDAHCPEY